MNTPGKRAVKYRKKLQKLEKDYGQPWQAKLREEVSAIKDKSIANLDKLVEKAVENFKRNGFKVHLVKTENEAFKLLNDLTKSAEYLVKSKSHTIERVLESAEDQKLKTEIVETDLGDFVASVVGKKDEHPVLPAACLECEEIADKLSKELGKTVQADPKGVSLAAREYLRKKICNAEIGLSGANVLTAQGSAVMLENEGNISLVSRLPEKHIITAGTEKLVENIDEAMSVVKAAANWGTGQRQAVYINVISGPSKTADIEETLVEGAQGTKEAHIILIDSRENIPEKFEEILKCINCGACLSVCPAYLASKVGSQYKGIKYLAEDYLAGRLSCKELFRCTTCNACEEICPAGIDLKKIMRELREECVEKGDYPEELEDMIKNIRETGNPFGKERGKIEKLYCC